MRKFSGQFDSWTRHVQWSAPAFSSWSFLPVHLPIYHKLLPLQQDLSNSMVGSIHLLQLDTSQMQSLQSEMTWSFGSRQTQHWQMHFGLTLLYMWHPKDTIAMLYQDVLLLVRIMGLAWMDPNMVCMRYWFAPKDRCLSAITRRIQERVAYLSRNPTKPCFYKQCLFLLMVKRLTLQWSELVWTLTMLLKTIRLSGSCNILWSGRRWLQETIGSFKQSSWEIWMIALSWKMIQVFVWSGIIGVAGKWDSCLRRAKRFFGIW